MIRNPASENMRINVFLINGGEFINKDVPQRPFGETEKIVYFWDDDKLVMYPINQVKRIELVFYDE